MLGRVMPRAALKNFVITPLRPRSMTHEYAPKNGADMQQSMLTTKRIFAPLRR